MTRQGSTSLFQSFNFAAEGVVHAVRTQRNLWIHFAIAIAVLVAAIGFGATKLELAVLLLAIPSYLEPEVVTSAVGPMIRAALVILALELIVIGWVRWRYGPRSRGELGGQTQQPATSS